MSPNVISREEMESRRIRACEMLARGIRRATVARTVGVSRTSATRWAKAVEGRADLRSRKASGRPCKLSPEQITKVVDLWWSRPRWTFVSFGAAIYEALDVAYSPDHVGRLVIRLGLRVKRPRKARLTGE